MKLSLKTTVVGLAVLTVALFAIDGQTAWFVARASGFVSLLFLVLSMAVGILGSTKSFKGLIAAGDVYEVHRIAGYLTVVALAVHMIGLLADNYIQFSISTLLVPGASSYRPVPVALGVIAAYLSVAVVFSFEAKKWIGKTAWRWIHFLNFPLLVFAIVHGILAGTDTPTAAGQIFYYVCGFLVFGMTTYRLLSPKRKAKARNAS